MRVAILGAGGVGGLLAADLARAGVTVRLVARGSHLDAIRAHGLRVETPDEDNFVQLDAVDGLVPDEAVDLAIVAVKSWSLDEVAAPLSKLAERGAIVLPLLNGVDAVDRLIAAGIRREQLLAGLVYVSAARVGDGHIRRTSPFRRAIVGEPGGGESSRANAIANLLTSAGWDAMAVPDIQLHLWQKFIFITAFASACALTRTPIGAVRDAPLGAALLDRAVAEIVSVAAASGVALPDGEAKRVRAQLDSMPASMKPSLLNDFIAGGPTEVNALCGAIARMGRMSGVETPIHDAATAAIHAGTRSA